MTHEEGEGLADLTEDLHDALGALSIGEKGRRLEEAIARERNYLRSLMNHPCGAGPQDLP